VKRWHHGHSIGTGVLIGTLLTRHPFLLFGGGVAVGVALAYVRQSAAWVADKVRHWRDFGPSRYAAATDGPTPVYSMRANPKPGSAQNDDRYDGGVPY
jgi:hypothetical protein